MWENENFLLTKRDLRIVRNEIAKKKINYHYTKIYKNEPTEKEFAFHGVHSRSTGFRTRC